MSLPASPQYRGPGRPVGRAREKVANPSENPFTKAVRQRRESLTGFALKLDQAKRADLQAVTNEINKRKKKQDPWFAQWSAASKEEKEEMRVALKEEIKVERVRKGVHASCLENTDPTTTDIVYWDAVESTEDTSISLPIFSSDQPTLPSLSDEESEDDDNSSLNLEGTNDLDDKIVDLDQLGDEGEDEEAASEDGESGDLASIASEENEDEEMGETDNEQPVEPPQSSIREVELRYGSAVGNIAWKHLHTYWLYGWSNLEKKLKLLNMIDTTDHKSFFRCLPPPEQQVILARVAAEQAKTQKGTKEWNQAQQLVDWTPPRLYFTQRELGILQNLFSWDENNHPMPGSKEWWEECGPEEMAWVFDKGHPKALDPTLAKQAYQLVFRTSDPDPRWVFQLSASPSQLVIDLEKKL